MENKLLKFNNREIALTGILLAFILLFVLVPMKILPIDVAFVPLIAVFIAAQIGGKKIGIFMATAFGLASLLAAFVRPTILSPIFYNPLVSVAPRIIIGVTTYFTFKAVFKFTSNKYRSGKIKGSKSPLFISSAASAIVGVFTNTSLVVSMLVIFNFGKTVGGVYIDKAFVLSLLGINFLIELAICAALTPPIAVAVSAALRKPILAESAENGKNTPDNQSEQSDTPNSI